MGTQLPGQEKLSDGISLYIHIPFCKSKCPYCDFNTYQGIEALMGSYLEALALEIGLWGRTLGHPRVNTIFFGGGTPSYLTIEHLAQVFHAARNAFNVSPDAEITLEANPDDLNLEKLKGMLGLGANRLSIGVQSLDDSLLSLLGRRHTAEDAMDAFRLARQAGFNRVNLDLMYGLPCQTMAQWESTLERMLELGPPHLSIYCLTLEEGTPLEWWVRQGRLPEPDPDLAADMYTRAEERLEVAGYHHYEISNWAMPGFQCLHNMAYWLNQPYLGVGPGAHSCLHGHRFWDVDPPRLYIQRVQGWASQPVPSTGSGQALSRVEGDVGPVGKLDRDALLRLGPVGGVETIEPRLEMAETMFLGLRLLDGLSIEDFKRRFAQDPMQLYGPQIQELTEQGLLEHSALKDQSVLRLTRKGCLLANQVFMRFLE